MVDWAKVRRDFPIAKRFAYLDNASCGPMPKPVHDCVVHYYDEMSGYSDVSWTRWLKRREAARARVARWINASPDEIAFTANCSQGINLIAELTAHRGTVLTNTLEFPATTVPFLHRKAKVKFLKPRDGVIETAQVRGALTRDVKTIMTSYVQFRNGFRQNLETVGKMKGGRFFAVNASQGFGYLPIDVKRAKIDFLATNCHKWMMAGYGSGIFYISKKWTRKLKPVSAGWQSVKAPDRYDNRSATLKTTAARYEMGCPSFPHIFAIGAALAYFSGIGRHNMERRILALGDLLISELDRSGFEIVSPRAPGQRSGIVVFKVKNVRKMTNQLLARRIYVSARGGGIRVAPHIYNTEKEIRLLVRSVKELSRSR